MHVKRPKSMCVRCTNIHAISCSVHVTCLFHAHPLHRVLPFFIVLEAFCKIIMDTFIKNSMAVHVGPSPMRIQQMSQVRAGIYNLVKAHGHSHKHTRTCITPVHLQTDTQTSAHANTHKHTHAHRSMVAL